MKGFIHRHSILIAFYAFMLAMIMILSVVANSHAANTTVKGPGIVHLVLDGSTDWSLLTDAGLRCVVVRAVQFNPSAANDRLVIRAGSLTGAVVYDSNPVGGTAPWKDDDDYGGCVPLFIDATDLVLGTPASASVILRVK